MVIRTLKDSSYEWGCEDCGKRRLERAHRGLRERNRERMRQGRRRNRRGTGGGAGADCRIPAGPGIQSPGPPLSDSNGMASPDPPTPCRNLAALAIPASRAAVLIRPRTHRPRRVSSSSTLRPWCGGTPYRMRDRVVAVLGLWSGITAWCSPLTCGLTCKRARTARPHSPAGEETPARKPCFCCGQLHPAKTSPCTRCRRISFAQGMPSSK